VAGPNKAPILIVLEPEFEIIKIYVLWVVGLKVVKNCFEKVFWLNILPARSFTISVN
jgi:hypothetical protein